MMPLNFQNSIKRYMEFLRGNKLLAFAPVDAALIAISLFLAFILRFEGAFPSAHISAFWLALPFLIGLNLAFLYLQKLYAFTWSFVGLTELTGLVKALAYASGLFALLVFIDRDTSNLFAGFPRSIIVINYFLNIILLGGLRLSKRVWQEYVLRRGLPGRGTKRMLLVGAGQEGEHLIRSLLATREKNEFELVGIVDHRPAKHNTFLHGIKVIGHIDDIPALKEQHSIESLIIALAPDHGPIIKRAVEQARSAGITHIKIIPQFADLLGQQISFELLKDISIEDLLFRKPVEIDTKTIKNFVQGQRVLVTGTAGSIGSEICRQLARFEPSLLLMLDFNESGLFDLEEEFKMKFLDQKIETIVANITDTEKIQRIFSEFAPDIVFHAAAYKHVPLMEYWPEEAIATNVFGAYIIAEAARAAGVAKFVLVSTDKAVRPTSVMGKTKRAAEIIVRALNELGPTKFVSVRFGNVLASRGSVVPLFEEQIKRRAPITVTHPEMQRYFMTIPEAALLVLEAGAVGQGGEIFTLDMGEPVKIVELAQEMVRLAGLEPDKDVPIVFTGVRPGEKLFEELLSEEEKRVGATQWEKVFISKNDATLEWQEIKKRLTALEEKLNASPEELREALDRFIS